MPTPSRPIPVSEPGRIARLRGGFRHGGGWARRNIAIMHKAGNRFGTAPDRAAGAVSTAFAERCAARPDESHAFNGLMYDCLIYMSFLKQRHDVVCLRSQGLPKGKGKFA